jgi:hypothetical protein
MQLYDAILSGISERVDGLSVASKKPLNLLRRTVSATNPDDVWGKAIQYTQVAEMSIFRDDCVLVFSGVRPDLTVEGSVQTDLRDVN